MLQPVEEFSRTSNSSEGSAPPVGVASDIVLKNRPKLRDLTPSEIEAVTGATHYHVWATGLYDSMWISFWFFGYRVSGYASYTYDLVIECQGGWVTIGAGVPPIWQAHWPQGGFADNIQPIAFQVSVSH